MLRHPSFLVDKARKMAVEKHLSFKELGRKFNISDSTLGIWCRDIKGANLRKYARSSRKRRLELKRIDAKILNSVIVSKDLAKIFCGIIYGCEGSKYPASNCVTLTNSDPSLITSFVNLLRLAYRLDESKWRVRLQVHSDQNYTQLASFWGKILDIPKGKFYSPTITDATQGRHRLNYLGTCSVKYYNYRLQLRLIGIYEQFMRKSSLLEGIPNGSGDGSLNHIA